LALQLAALCHREGSGGREVLLVSSSRGRWILPKGWPIEGKTSAEAAEQEAWEEAGVKAGDVSDAAIGSFRSEKRYSNGETLACKTEVYSIAVTQTTPDFPEADRRKQIWVAPEVAAVLVDEEGLKALLTKF
jgi:8-oxo-dGTP pyrophosphatase MutT (NUDIX family)